MKIAIAFTIYNRPDYLKETLDSWEKVRFLDNCEFFFKVEPSNKVNENLLIINKFKKSVTVPVHIVVNRKTAGVGVNQAQALSLVFNKHSFDAVIMAEDDIIVSSDIVEYFDHCFKNHKTENILTVCAHRYTTNTGDDEALLTDPSFDPWIWGIWKDNWKQYLENDWDLTKFMLDDKLVGGFDFHIVYRVLPKHDMVSIFPDITRSKHIGVNGTYARESEYFDNPYYIQDRKKSSFKPLDK